MTLHVGTVPISVAYLPLYVAEQEHYFQAQGLTLSPSPPPVVASGAKLASAVEANSVELAAGTITDAFSLSRIDANVKVLGAFMDGFDINVIASKKFEQQTHLTEASPLQERVKALVGKKIGVVAPGTGTEALLIYLFRMYGYDTDRDATIVDLGGNITGAISALSLNRVDAISYFAPAAQEAELQGIGDQFISPANGDVPTMRGQVHEIFYAKQQLINTKPKAVQAFIRAIAQAEAFIHKNPAQATAFLEKYLNLDPKLAAASAKAFFPIMAQSPRIDPAGYEVADQFHVKAGLIAVPLAYNDLVAVDTINKALS